MGIGKLQKGLFVYAIDDALCFFMFHLNILVTI